MQADCMLGAQTVPINILVHTTGALTLRVHGRSLEMQHSAGARTVAMDLKFKNQEEREGERRG